MIFSVAELVSFLSQGMTLEPGDVIITGTPPGVGMARDPQLWMKPGDEITIEIEGLGTLTNPVEAGEGSPVEAHPRGGGRQHIPPARSGDKAPAPAPGGPPL